MEKYSFLMSVYFREKPERLTKAIESMLNQTLKSEEIFIICDGPLTDELDEVIISYQKKFPELFTIHRLSKNLGLGSALAIGIRECRNEIIARMDSDDISVSYRMEKTMDFLSKHPELSVVGGQIAEFNGDIDNIVDYRNVPLDNEKIRKMLKNRNPMNHVTTVMKKSDVIACGNYEDVFGFEDYLLWANMLCNGKKFGNINEVVVYVRVDNNMYLRRSGSSYYNGSRVLEKSLKNYGEINSFGYAKNIFIRFVGYKLMPNFVRKFFYQKLMREKAVKN